MGNYQWCIGRNKTPLGYIKFTHKAHIKDNYNRKGILKQKRKTTSSIPKHLQSLIFNGQ